MDMHQKKSILRKQYLEIRNNADKTEQFLKNRLIYARLCSFEPFANAARIFTFISFGSEVDTAPVISELLKKNKPFAVPRIEKHGIEFIEITSMDNLKKNSFGIYEPVGGTIAVPDKDSVMLVPGLVFSENKYRIGFGKGYYDKYLANKPDFTKIGLCFEFQIVNDIINEYHDEKVDYILTDKKIRA